MLCDLLHGGDAPIVLTGAIRPASATGADGPANLLDAVRAAGDRGDRGPRRDRRFGGELHAARAVRKTDSVSPRAFPRPHRPGGARVREARRGLVRARRRPAAAGLAARCPGGDRRPRSAPTARYSTRRWPPAPTGSSRSCSARATRRPRSSPPAARPPRRCPWWRACGPSVGRILRATYGFAGAERDVRDAGLICAPALSPAAADHADGLPRRGPLTGRDGGGVRRGRPVARRLDRRLSPPCRCTTTHGISGNVISQDLNPPPPPPPQSARRRCRDHHAHATRPTARTKSQWRPTTSSRDVRALSLIRDWLDDHGSPRPTVPLPTCPFFQLAADLAPGPKPRPRRRRATRLPAQPRPEVSLGGGEGRASRPPACSLRASPAGSRPGVCIPPPARELDGGTTGGHAAATGRRRTSVAPALSLPLVARVGRAVTAGGVLRLDLHPADTPPGARSEAVLRGAPGRRADRLDELARHAFASGARG